MSKSSSVLQLVDVERHFVQGGRRINVLNKASLSLEAGRMTALIGPSGAGKTTLLNMAGLLERPDSGDVVVGGVRTAQLSEAKRTMLRRQQIGFVFQFHRLFPEFSARENVIIPQMLNGLTYKKADERPLPYWLWLVLRNGLIIAPAYCRAESSNVLPLRARWQMRLIFCWQMSQQEIWTPKLQKLCLTR